MGVCECARRPCAVPVVAPTDGGPPATRASRAPPLTQRHGQRSGAVRLACSSTGMAICGWPMRCGGCCVWTQPRGRRRSWPATSLPPPIPRLSRFRPCTEQSAGAGLPMRMLSPPGWSLALPLVSWPIWLPQGASSAHHPQRPQILAFGALGVAPGGPPHTTASTRPWHPLPQWEVPSPAQHLCAPAG